MRRWSLTVAGVAVFALWMSDPDSPWLLLATLGTLSTAAVTWIRHCERASVIEAFEEVSERECACNRLARIGEVEGTRLLACVGCGRVYAEVSL